MMIAVRRAFSSAPLHAAALASFAVAQPLFDVLGNAPDFLLAHDLGPIDILAVVLILGAAVPALVAFVVWVFNRVHPLLGRAAVTIFIMLFATLIALYALSRWTAGPWVIVAVAASAGVGAGAAYHRSAGIRAFTGWLAPGIVVFPILFLMRPGVQRLMWPPDAQAHGSSAGATPVVMVVFDGLPLTALLDENHGLDRHHYPSFAAFADRSTWYRNATAVSDYTRWAVPAILSGRNPAERALPIAGDHPDTIFTLLGSSHEVSALEPISRVCPPTICDHGGAGVIRKMAAFVPTLSVSYLHTVWPEAVSSYLPPVDQGWAEGIPPSETPSQVWLIEGEESRRGRAARFIGSIRPGASRPSFHFLHLLLPHTPLAYLPGGQRYGTERYLPGLEERRDRWTNDEWAVTQGHQRFLLQAGYVDTLLGQLIQQLKAVGLFDKSLIVVTSDHGASFRAGQAFRRVTDQTFMDVLPIPFLIKAPNQQAGAVSDRNVESIDVLSTVAEILGVELPWHVDGASAAGGAAPRPAKAAYVDDARQVKTFGASLLEAAYSSVERKLALFGPSDGNYYRIPRTSPNFELIGRDIDELRVSDAAPPVELAFDVSGDFSNVRPDGRFVPAQLAGRARWTDSSEPVTLAVAVNGQIRATTRTYRFSDRGSPNRWSVVLPADSFVDGPNDVSVFMVRSSGPDAVLYRSQFAGARPVNLLSSVASYGLGVVQKGLYVREGTGESALTWTDGSARIVVPREGGPAPRSLRVSLAPSGPADKSLRILVNGCELFDGRIPPQSWSRILSLSTCDDREGETVIELSSDTHADPDSRDDRVRGVAIRKLDLLKDAWPPAPPLPAPGRRSQIVLANVPEETAPIASNASITARILNRGSSIWATPEDLGQENGGVRLGALWFPASRTGDQPAAVQRIELPQSMVPGDELEFVFQLVPSDATGASLPPGDYEVWIGLLQEGVSWFYASGDSVRKLRVVHDARP